MTWAGKRKFIIFIALLVVVALFVGLPAYVKIYQAPTCTDNKMNQGEIGVDCGGPCSSLCQALVEKPLILWSRSFKVSDGIYNSVAYLQNPNSTSGARDVRYMIRLYDKENVIIAEREGEGDILPGKITPLFEANIGTGLKIPARTTFEFLEDPFWETQTSFPDIRIISKVFTRENTQPHFDVVVKNVGYTNVRDISLVAILFDAEGNAMAASRSILDGLEQGQEEDVVFFWPEPFSVPVVGKEVFPVVAPVAR